MKYVEPLASIKIIDCSLLIACLRTYNHSSNNLTNSHTGCDELIDCCRWGNGHAAGGNARRTEQ